MAEQQAKTLLGLTSLTALVVANMLGAGVFVTSGYALADLGSPHRVMAAWLIGGAIALSGALSYGALSRRLSQSGGEYLFLSRVFHPLAGFIAGWISLLAGFTGAIALAALTLEHYLPMTPTWLPPGGVASLMVIAAALIHGIRLRGGILGQNLVVAVKLALIGGLILFAAISAHNVPIPAPAPPFSLPAFAATLVWISLSYSGFNAAVYVAGEARDAKKNVPRALLLGTSFVILLYLALNACFVYLPPLEAVQGRRDIAVAAAEALGGPSMVVMVRILIATALLTSIFSMVMAGPRVYARMADDGLFPKVFRFRGEVPRRAIFLQAALAVFVICFTSLKELLSYLGFSLSLCSAWTVCALFVLRRREDATAVPVPFYPFVPAFYVIATLLLAFLAAQNAPMEMLAALITAAPGTLLYFLMRKP